MIALKQSLEQGAYKNQLAIINEQLSMSNKRTPEIAKHYQLSMNNHQLAIRKNSNPTNKKGLKRSINNGRFGKEVEC